MADNHDRFIQAYNRLDAYLQTLVKVSGHITMISYLEQISPEKTRSELKAIRQYRNALEHGVHPGSKRPTVPEDWILFLARELEWCKRNAGTIAPKLQRAVDASRKGSQKAGAATSREDDPSVFTKYYDFMYGIKRASPTSGNSQPKASTNARSNSKPSTQKYTFVNNPPKVGLFAKTPDGYGWVICNHNGDFLTSATSAWWSKEFRNAIVFETEREAKKVVKSLKNKADSDPQFFRIRCVELL